MSSSTQFYVTLPSNASLSLYPDNTLSSYTTRLVDQINLTGNWEVAITEIHYPFSWYNVTDDNNSFAYSSNGRFQVYGKIKPGYYSSIEEVVRGITEKLTEDGRSNINISVDKISGKVHIRLRSKAYIYFNDQLYRMLGLPSKSVNQSTGGEVPIDISNGFYGMYVYCDIVQNQLVGDVSAPLLRVVPLQTVGASHGETIAHTFTIPHYIPVKTKKFEIIHIDIRKDTGEKVSSQRGKLTVALHFRKVRPSLY